MSPEIVTERELKTVEVQLHDPDAWKRGLKSNQEGPAFQLLKSAEERAHKIDAYRREVSRNILTMFNDLGRDLTALKDCYETNTGFFEAVRKGLNIQRAQAYRVMQLHKSWPVLVDGMCMLPSSLSITTLTQAIDFVKEIKASGLSEVEQEPESEEDIRTTGEKFSAACRKALNRTEKGTPATKNVHSRVLPTLRKLVNPEMQERGLITKDEQVQISHLEFDLMQIIGRIEEREKDFMTDFSSNQQAQLDPDADPEAPAAMVDVGAREPIAGPAEVYPGTKENPDQAQESLERLERDIAAAGNAALLALSRGWGKGAARKRRTNLNQAIRGEKQT